jgi:hypothetical protein
MIMTGKVWKGWTATYYYEVLSWYSFGESEEEYENLGQDSR